MPIDYSNTGKSTSNVLDTIRAINGISPTPDYAGADISRAGSGPGLFSLTPDDVSGRFDEAYQKGSDAYDPFPGDTSKIDQLQGVFGGVKKAFDVRKTIEALNRTRGINLTVGEQASQAAANRFSETATPGSQSNATGAALVRAQSLLPFLQADTAAAGETRKYADSAKQNALSKAADIASTLAKLQNDYTDSLANYNAGKAKNALDFATSKSGLALRASESNIESELGKGRLAEEARQANLTAALQTRQQDLSARTEATNQSLTAADLLSKSKPSQGSYTTDALGRITSGQSTYDQYQQYLKNIQAASGTLGGIV